LICSKNKEAVDEKYSGIVREYYGGPPYDGHMAGLNTATL
jgi:hypothetical protein